MAKATKFIAALPDGSFATRSSVSKTYTFCVAVRESYENALAAAKKNWPHDASNFHHYKREIDPATRQYKHSDANVADMVDRIAGCGNVDMYKAKVVAERVADVEKMKAAGNYDRWGVLGWCSRLDLAQKLRAGQGSKPHFAEAAICPVEIKQ